ncbi:MAG: DMT family transporter [Chloroflexota bacterium]|nr:DMT family transporter [Chloroflexota bacterium]
MDERARSRAAAREKSGMLYGFLGVAAFSLTLPFTRIAVAYFDPTFIGLGRALAAAVLAGILLWVTRQPLPTKRQVRSLAVIGLGVILGFPLLSAWAISRLPSSHGAIVLGLLPLATALAGTIRAGERPSPRFWLASVAGSAIVVSFALISSGGQVSPPDLALLGAVAAAAVGYAEGTRLTHELGGWQVISWTLVLGAPFIVVPVVLAAGRQLAPPTIEAWLAFAYLACISQFAGFFAWYRGLALGGVARVSQLQLLQPFLTLGVSALLLGEVITPLTMVAAVLVLATVALGRRARVRSIIDAQPEE